MHFEKRDLKPYAEPISAADLKEGAIYFFVNFIDDAMLIPTMEAVVFIGRNLSADDVGQIYFQDVGSYQNGIRYDAALKDENGLFYSGPEGQTGHVFEYERAVDELIRCAQRRKRISTSG